MARNRAESFRDAFRGLLVLVRSQLNARIHLTATIMVIAAGFTLSVSGTEWCVLLIAIGLVWSAEAFNTSLEFLADRVAPEKHELVRKAKDCAAAGVLAVSLAAAAAGLVIFLPRVIRILH